MHPDTSIALLRGINVGGHNLLPMKALKALFLQAGCREVTTYVQSGNVVFQSDPPLAEALPAQIRAAIQANFGFDCPILIRSAAELQAIIQANPFPQAEQDPITLHVGFLGTQPDPDRIARLDPQRSPPDAFVVRGREIYLHYPRGSGKSKLTHHYLESTLATPCTARNWRTVLALADLVRQTG